MKEDSSDYKNNIIDFPSSKSHCPKKSKYLSLGLKQKKVIISTSLVSILFLVTLLNRSLDPAKEAKETENTYASNSQGRHIANVEKQDWNNHLVERLAKPTRRAFASIGRKPTSRESFIYGDFLKYRDRYVVVFDEIDQHLISMNYISPVGVGDSETSAPSSEAKIFRATPEEFFQSYKSLFPKGSVELIPLGEPTKTDQGRQERIYHLLDDEQKVLAKVKFTTTGANGEYLYSYQTIK